MLNSLTTNTADIDLYAKYVLRNNFAILKDATIEIVDQPSNIPMIIIEGARYTN